jgi:hypothetical protein
MKYILWLLLLLGSFSSFSQEDSVIVKRYNDYYVEIQSLRYRLDSTSSAPTGEVFGFNLRPKPIKMRDGIQLIKDRNNRPLYLNFYADSILVQENWFHANGAIGEQQFNGDKNSCNVSLQWYDDSTLYRIRFICKKQKIQVTYENGGTPVFIMTD